MITTSVIGLKWSNTTTTTSILMPLTRLAGVSNFCSNSFLPFPSIVRILSSQANSFEILLYAIIPRFPWSTLLPFPSYFNFYNLTYLGIDVSTHDMTIPPHQSSQQHPSYHKEHQSTSCQPVSPHTS